MNPIKHLSKKFKTIYSFYRDGFKGMTLGKQLWKIIFIKLFVMFVILKLFFFPNFLSTNFETNDEKASFVLEQMTNNLTSETLNETQYNENYQEEK